jgi:ABC-type Zn uptake system ZnuABC Zn-binding protein ZnuA
MHRFAFLVSSGFVRGRERERVDPAPSIVAALHERRRRSQTAATGLRWSRFACLLLFVGAVCVSHAAERPVVVVTTSLIATAVRDVAGDAVDIETLMPAGTCPGQFDLEPQQVRRVRSAVLVIRHDMQGFLDARFAAAGVPADAVIAPAFGEPFNVPTNYAEYCARLAAELARRVPAVAAVSGPRLAAIRAQAERTADEMRRQAQPLAGVRVVAAAFQAGFLRWLGLDVVATFPPADDPPPGVLKTAVASGRARGAALVVGNEQNGRRVPAAIAQALGVEVAMLSNFPARTAAGAYWELVQTNLKVLLDRHALQKNK